MTALDELIDVLRAATEGSRKLNEQIFAAMNGYKKVGGSLVSGGMLVEDFWLTGAPDDIINYQVLMGSAPPYTYNIATARSLIDSGMLFSVEGNANDHQESRYGKARIWCAPEYSEIKSMRAVDVEAKAASPALAICLAAALAKRARVSAYSA